MGERKVRLACPRNCYDGCSIIATVEGGRLVSVEGDPAHPITGGRLCAKGYGYVERVYAADRLRHPLIRTGERGAGQWRMASWDEALGLVAQQIIGLDRRYGSLLSVCLYRASGNIGAMHEAPDALFHAMGPYTVADMVLCWAAGREAQQLDFGANSTSDPRELLQASTIFLWGVNPAWTAPHNMRLIMEARDRGATVVTIDPVTTATASRSDLHLSPRVGTDGALALGMARVILEEGLHDPTFLESHVHGWPAFRDYLKRDITVEWAAAETGLPADVIRKVARLYATARPAWIWIGFGLQRHAGAVQTVRAIDALAAMTGQIGLSGAGAHYAHQENWQFGRVMKGYQRPHGREPYRGPGAVNGNRVVPMGAIAWTLPRLEDVPVRMLYICGANPVMQEPDAAAVRGLLQSLEFVVVTDQFLTETAALADVVLPATTCFEHWDLLVSYWHHLGTVSQPALPPRFEARSDLQIAWALSRKLNQIAPGFCTFPTEGDEEDWVRREWMATSPTMFGGVPFNQALEGPVPSALPRVAWADRVFATPSGRFELASARAVAQGLPALPEYAPPPLPEAAYPYQLLTPHPAESLHSQFRQSAGGLRPSAQPLAEMHPDLAARHGLYDGDAVRISNSKGAVQAVARITRSVPPETVVLYEAAYPDPAYNVNLLTSGSPRMPGDPGSRLGVPYLDCWVAVAPAERRAGR